MRLRLTTLIMPLSAAAVAAVGVRVSSWDSIKMALITALSVAAAAALVRLARGLPFTTASHYEPQEIKNITIAVTQLARALRSFLGVTLTAMGLLIMTAPLLEIAHRHADSALVFWGGRSFSALIGATLAYVAVRLFQIVNSDLSLLSEQSKFMIRAVEREQQKEREKIEAAAGPATSFRTPEGYGQTIIQ